jgi:hypothetical protein
VVREGAAALEHDQRIEVLGSTLGRTSILPKFVIFDLDGVLRLWPKNDGDSESKFGLNMEAISEVASEPKFLRDCNVL